MTPFMKKDVNGENRINVIRIVEAIVSSIVVASITTGVMLYVGQRVMGEKVNSIECNVKEMKTEMKDAVENHEQRIRNVEIKLAGHGIK